MQIDPQYLIGLQEGFFNKPNREDRELVGLVYLNLRMQHWANLDEPTRDHVEMLTTSYFACIMDPSFEQECMKSHLQLGSRRSLRDRIRRATGLGELETLCVLQSMLIAVPKPSVRRKRRTRKISEVIQRLVRIAVSGCCCAAIAEAHSEANDLMNSILHRWRGLKQGQRDTAEIAYGIILAKATLCEFEPSNELEKLLRGCCQTNERNS